MKYSFYGTYLSVKNDWTFEIPQTLDLLKTSDKLVLGDSHSISVYKEGHTISRNDGKTLKGFLNKGLQNYKVSCLTIGNDALKKPSMC